MSAGWLDTKQTPVEKEKEKKNSWQLRTQLGRLQQDPFRLKASTGPCLPQFGILFKHKKHHIEERILVYVHGCYYICI